MASYAGGFFLAALGAVAILGAVLPEMVSLTASDRGTAASLVLRIIAVAGVAAAGTWRVFGGGRARRAAPLWGLLAGAVLVGLSHGLLGRLIA